MADVIRQDIGLATKSNRVIKVWREGMDRYALTGCIVDTSDEFLVVHCMSDAIRLDGYSLIRITDITSIDRDPRYGDFYEKALKLMKDKPRRPKNLRLENMYSVLQSLDENYPLISVEREKVKNDECAIGKIHMMSENMVVLKWLTPDAKWKGNSPRYRLRDITKIDFDTSYINVLATVARVSKPKTKKSPDEKKRGRLG